MPSFTWSPNRSSKLCRGESTAQNLRTLEKELAATSPVDEIRSLKAEIARALHTICRD